MKKKTSGETPAQIQDSHKEKEASRLRLLGLVDRRKRDVPVKVDKRRKPR